MTIRCAYKNGKVSVWIVGPRGGKQTIDMGLMMAMSFRVLLDQAISKAEINGEVHGDQRSA